MSKSHSRVPSLIALFLVSAMIAACSRSPAEPQVIFPDMPEPDTFTRAYTLAESPDGTIRMFAKENGDLTELFESVKGSDGKWSEPVKIDYLPHSIKLSGPAFHPVDGTLYYASDEPIEVHQGRRESNIWSARRENGKWVDPELLPLEINTGANENSPTLDGQGRLYFSTNHSRAGGGGLDIMQAEFDAEANKWVVEPMPAGINDFRADDHLAVTRDGQTLFFYSHRSPKFGVVDIWRTQRDASGVWQTPERLAEPVNSESIDFGAGISADGETFFFSRDGVLMSYPMKSISTVQEE